MAEILIQRKRRRSIWPWLMGLLALALLPLPFLNDRDQLQAARQTVAVRRDSVVQPDTTAMRDTAAVASSTVSDGSPGAAASTTAVATSGSASASRGAPGTVADTAAGATSGAAKGAPGTAPAGERTTAIAAGAIAPPETARPTTPASPASAAKSASDRESFERFITAAEPRADERAQRQYTAGGLRRLADELATLGASRAGLRAIRVHADSLQTARARRGAQPDYARAAFLAAVHELDVLRGRYRVPVDTGRLRATAWAIRPNRTLAAQRGTVQRFFETARDALQALSRRR